MSGQNKEQHSLFPYAGIRNVIIIFLRATSRSITKHVTNFKVVTCLLISLFTIFVFLLLQPDWNSEARHRTGDMRSIKNLACDVTYVGLCSTVVLQSC